MKNSLFQYATSELSQDAFICWCLNWFNDNRKPKLREMAISLVQKMAGDITVNNVDIVRQYSKKVKTEDGKTIYVKIDVLAIINQSIGLIIEDKTFTDEHDDQINRYRDGLRRILTEDGGQIESGDRSYNLDPNLIRTVFWKTGFHYDYDQVVIADVKFDGTAILEYLWPYRGESEILDDYLENLKRDIEWYNNHQAFHEFHEAELYNWRCALARYTLPQYCLMRAFFPSNRWRREAGKK